jgi:NAD(P)H dehydrogenase (quinone)
MIAHQTGPFLVTGASGQLGRLALDHLLHAGARPVITTTRSPEKLADYAARGVEVRAADFADSSSLARAFAGARRMLLISTDDLVPGRRFAAHRAAIAAAARAGIQHIVYTSLTNPGPESPILFAVDHRDTEAELRASGIPHTILRNNLYTDLFLLSAPQAVATGQLVAAAGQGTVGYVTRDDCAGAAAAALLNATGTATFDITGPALVGQADVATQLSVLAGKPVAYVPIDIPSLEAAMVQHGLPAPVANVLASIDAAIAAGALSVVSTAVEQLTGVAPMSVADFLAAHTDTIRGRHG